MLKNNTYKYIVILKSSIKISILIIFILIMNSCANQPVFVQNQENLQDSIYENDGLASAQDELIDNDEDGYSITAGDCDDQDPSIYPGATEILGDGIDQDCSGLDKYIISKSYYKYEKEDLEIIFRDLIITEYNSMGQETSYFHYDDINATEISEMYLYEYDESFNLLTKERDNDGDGTLDIIYSYEYDKDGNMSKEIYDNDADGKEDKIFYYVYKNSNLVSEQRDNDANGSIDHIYSFEYDEKGNLSKAIYDYDADNTDEYIKYYEYDDNNNLLKEELDYENDEVIDYYTSYQLDENQNIIRVEYGNQGSDYVFAETYEYDNNGNNISYSYDSGNDNNYEHIKTYEYDENGNNIKLEDDSDGDNNIDLTYEYDYDDYGNLIFIKVISLDNDPYIGLTFYTYSEGNIESKYSLEDIKNLF
ncbi:MAG: putative metal-binding motif-containing protein [Pseudomonadota bacterium]